MKIRRLSRAALTAGVLTMTSVAAIAFPGMVKDFTGTYGVGKDSTLGKATCAVCHIGKSPKLNPYGVDLQKVMKADKVKKLTSGVFKKIETLDSDKDGKKNVDEIKGDTNPGDAKSK